MDADETDRPKPPFGTADGETPRIEATLAAGGPVEYRPGEINVDIGKLAKRGASAEMVHEQLRGLLDRTVELLDFDEKRVSRTGFVVARVELRKGEDLLGVIARANAEIGDDALSPNTVFRIAGVTADPMRFASTFWADPMRFASLLADPMRFASFLSDPMRFANSSTARPAGPPVTPGSDRQSPVAVAILDTGDDIEPGDPPAAAVDVEHQHAAGVLRERPDENADQYLDIAAGHTTFIRSIIHRVGRPAEYWLSGVIHNDGDGAESDVALALEKLHDDLVNGTFSSRHLIVNLSFSGYYVADREPPRVAAAIRALTALGVVVVAAAGNDGGCRKKYPAAMPEVLSVGSVGPCGPSPFSNHGPWVDVSAPGEDLVARFFDGFDGKHEPSAGSGEPDIDDFGGWASWSGTSFSTATVVGVLASTIEQYGCSAREAVEIVVTQPGLFRLTDYGVVLNRMP